MKSSNAVILSFILINIGTNLCFGTPTVYVGSLSVGSGLIATGNYNNPSTSMSWVVDNTTTPGLWHYSYTLVTPVQSISHLIIEASNGDQGSQFTLDDLFSYSSTPTGWIGSITVQTQATGGANPSMPEDMWGIKFNSGTVTASTITISFDADRQPVWGDFYAKDGSVPGGGTFNAVYNAGFTSPDFDPTAPASSGSLQYHILVPDSYIPAPGAIVLCTIGIGVISSFRKRRML